MCIACAVLVQCDFLQRFVYNGESVSSAVFGVQGGAKGRCIVPDYLVL